MLMTHTTLDAIIKDPPGSHSHTVIWLHGLGADGHDFVGMLDALGLPADHGIRFIFPHAPERPITINGGAVMRGWYDIKTPQLLRHEDFDSTGLSASLKQLKSLIDAQLTEVPAERLLLAGFSQGGLVALWQALTLGLPIAGVIALSCYLPMLSELKGAVSLPNQGFPVFLGHGSLDPLVPVVLGEKIRDDLQRFGLQPEWHVYPMQHQVCMDEIKDIRQWLSSRVEVA